VKRARLRFWDFSWHSRKGQFLAEMDLLISAPFFRFWEGFLSVFFLFSMRKQQEAAFYYHGARQTRMPVRLWCLDGLLPNPSRFA
jgi:hypothetical protein